MLQAMAVIWTHAGLRQNELMRLTAGCIIPQSEDINRDDGSTIPAGTLCYLNVPAGKTSKAFVKPVSAVVKKYVDIWLAERPEEQAALTDERTGEKVRFLFQYRGKPVGRDIINRTVIPVLCARAGVPEEDSRGPITSHRGRASAVTARQCSSGHVFIRADAVVRTLFAAIHHALYSNTPDAACCLFC